MRRRHVGARGDGGIRLHDLLHDGVAHLCRAGAYAPRQRRGLVGIRGVAGAECVACRDAVVAGVAGCEAGVGVGGVRVEFRVQDAGAHRESAQRREGPGGEDRHRDGVGAGRSKGRPVTVSVNARSPAVTGAVKLGRAVSAPVSVTGAPLACVHA